MLNTGASLIIFIVARIYLWYDEKKKAVKYSAPQYVDMAMSHIQKCLDSAEAFPTRFGKRENWNVFLRGVSLCSDFLSAGETFPGDYMVIASRIMRLLFNVLAHLFQMHFSHLVELDMRCEVMTVRKAVNQKRKPRLPFLISSFFSTGTALLLQCLFSTGFRALVDLQRQLSNGNSLLLSST